MTAARVPLWRPVRAMQTARPCRTAVHVHCSRCGVSSTDDGTVATTPTVGGGYWPPLCSSCAARLRRATRSPRIAFSGGRA